MWIRKNKISILNKTIENLSKTLEEGNFIELSYILGNKKEIIKRNLIAGIFRGIGIRHRSNSNNSNINNNIAKNSNIKYSNNRRVYSRYSRNSPKKQITFCEKEKYVYSISKRTFCSIF